MAKRSDPAGVIPDKAKAVLSEAGTAIGHAALKVTHRAIVGARTAVTSVDGMLRGREAEPKPARAKRPKRRRAAKTKARAVRAVKPRRRQGQRKPKT